MFVSSQLLTASSNGVWVRYFSLLLHLRRHIWMNLKIAKRLKRFRLDIYNKIIHVFIICNDIIKTRRGISKIDCLHDAAFACPKMCWKYISYSQLVGRSTNKKCMYSCIRYHTYTIPYYCKLLLVLFTAIIKARLGRWLHFFCGEAAHCSQQHSDYCTTKRTPCPMC